MFAQKLLVPSLVAAMVKHVVSNRNSEHRVGRFTLKTHLTSERDELKEMAIRLWM